MHVSENPTAGVSAPPSDDEDGGTDHPTVQLPALPYSGALLTESDDETSDGGFADESAGVPPATETSAWESAPIADIEQADAAAYSDCFDGPGEGSSALVVQTAGPAERPAYNPDPVPQTPYPELATTSLLRPVKPPPSEGWRRLLYVLSGRLINVGEGARAARHNNLVAQVNRPLRGCYRIALLSLKGGVGKTTITATLGSTFASVRGDRVVAVDASPDRGTLSQKVSLETPATVRHLLRDADGIERYSDVRGYTSQSPSGLEVLASDSDPAVSDVFGADDYVGVLEILERFYGLVLTDCGTGLLHSAMSAVLEKSDALIVVSSASIDGARSASATLDWLDAHGHEDLVRNSIAVINGVRPRSGKVDVQQVVEHFSRRCRAVRIVPFDPHLEAGAEVSLGRLKRETRDALTELAAVIADAFLGDLRRSNPDFA
ncbi:MinD/ParA family ATP-binding protein [Mycobacterium sp.]|uniref:MinD/ParA family ATP-binding protein n=1 Tax=Mycobacterium sp. TaxID=1785 RepID=UPI003BAD3D6D